MLSKPLVVRSHEDIIEFCKENEISIKSFNELVIIPDGVTDCDKMFLGCSSFKQPITIPASVMRCEEMFDGCRIDKSNIQHGSNDRNALTSFFS